MANNKVQLSNGTVVIDLTTDTVTSASHIKSGLVGHLADGTTATGTLVEKDVKSVTYNLTGGATASISTSEVVTGQGFSVKLKVPARYNLNRVTVMMGGVDITSQVFTPDASGSGSAELGTKTITTNGTYDAEDDDLDGYSSVTVNVPTPAPNLQTKSVSYTPTTSAQSAQVTADSGYDGLQQVNVSVGAIPSEYIIPSGTKSITANGTGIDVTQYASVDVAVSGTSKNVQVIQGTTRTTSSSMTAIGAEMTVSKTGTYDVYWSAFRSSTSSSYTYATQLYVDGTAYGSENATWSNHVQNNHLSNVSLTANQKIRVYGRESRGSSYYMYAPTLVIVEA